MIVEVLGEIFMPKFMAQIINNGVQHQNVGYIVTMGLVMLGTAVQRLPLILEQMYAMMYFLKYRNFRLAILINFLRPRWLRD